MVSTRHQRVLSDDEGEGSDREMQRGRSGEQERRRVDPVVKEARKRGLDVEKLHGSMTPAWRNLRGRTGGPKKQSYFEGPEDEEDELQDHPSDGEQQEVELEEEEADSSESSEGEEEEGEDGVAGEEQHRYARRVRQTVQRYSPPKDDGVPLKEEGVQPRVGKRRPGKRRDYQQDRADSCDEEGGPEDDPSQDNDLFALRYSVRQRRQVEFFNPVKLGSQQPADSGPPLPGSRRQRERDREDEGKRRREDEQTDDFGEEERQERRQYSFRDRALVTIKPPSQPPAPPAGGLYRHSSGRISGGGGGCGQHERKRPRHERERHHGISRLHRTGSCCRLRDDEDEVDDPEEDGDLRAVGHYRGGGGGGGGGIGGGMAGGGGPAPWDLVQSAGANLPLSHLGREKAGNAEITPLQVDPSVSFDTVGGLDHYIKALKEMIFLPLVYPELFERFHITPPRGVLFYGPPGTGKTLVARALAAHASSAGKKVSFFMRKGADVLSKWVGEAERQLRLLFEEAQRHQPAIIFFDEIDGLAPVRSSKQDQIHNSIVSTLLALMDGLDARGQVVVIGATNRVDALDGALRRPGRFDRELVFPLPNLSARADILAIHTKKWADAPSPELLQELASLCVGYCGADLKALCTEASLASLRRHYPQIYDADDKLAVEPERVRVQHRDFLTAFQTITPASHRSAAANARPLPPLVAPVLLDQLQRVLAQLQASFPAATACLRSGFGGRRNPAAGFGTLADDAVGGGDADELPGSSFSWASGASLGVQRPRLLICGPDGSGQAHLGPAVLYALEGLPVHAIGLPSLLSDAGARAPEEALVHAVVEARRAAPAVLFLPHLQVWWDTAPNSLRATLWMLLADLPADLPLLLFATADVPASELDPAVQQLFNVQSGGAYQLEAPTGEQRTSFFRGISQALALPPPPLPAVPQQEARPEPLPALPRAPEAVAAEAAAQKKKEELEARQRYEEDQAVLRTLRMTLRELTMQLLASRRWQAFWEPEGAESDWWDKVSEPMDLATMLSRVDARQYATPHDYLADMARIVQCSREYWGPDLAGGGVREVSRACALEDEARTALARTVPPELQARLEEMAAQGGPAPPPPSLLLVSNLVVPMDGKTPGVHLLVRRPLTNGVQPQSDDAAARRATRHAAASTIDNRLLHTDPEAMRRHILAQRKQEQQQVQASQDAATAAARSQQLAGIEATPQQPMEEAAVGKEEKEHLSEAAAAAAAAGATEREVLVESTKENLPEPPAASVAAASTPVADGTNSAGSAKAGKVTLMAIVEQHSSSRLWCEGSAKHVPTAVPAEQQLQEPGTAAAAAADAAQPEQLEQEPVPPPAYQPTAADHARLDRLQAELVQCTTGLVLDNLESIHAKLSRLALEQRLAQNRDEVADAALAAVREWHTARQ